MVCTLGRTRTWDSANKASRGVPCGVGFQYLGFCVSRKLKDQIAQHAASDFHRLSAGVFNSPQFMLAPMATQNLKACSGAGRDQELIGRVDDAVSSGAAQSTEQPAAPSKEALHSCDGTLDLAIGSIQDPFRGNLPQREEWVDVWADSTSVISFRKQEAVKEKRAVAQIECRRKRLMVAVLAEVVRGNC